MKASSWFVALTLLVACGDDDSGVDASFDTGSDAGSLDTGFDSGRDSGIPLPDTGPDVRSDTGGPQTLSGTVFYEDRPFDRTGFTGALPLVPVRNAPVTIVAGGASLETTTDESGQFEVELDAASVTVRVRAEGAIGDHRVEVVDRSRTGEIYELEATVALGEPVELVATLASGLGGPFNIADVAQQAFSLYAPYVGAAAPTLTYRWERGRPFSCGSCYGGDTISLGGGEDDTDEYDDDIILHELGHYFVDHYSGDSSPGGSHRDRQVEPRLAFGEGLGYFFALLVSGRPYIVDTFIDDIRVIDYDAMTQNGASRADFLGTTGGANGDLREEIVAGIFYDAFDPSSAEEPFDRVALGQDGTMALLVDYFGTWPHADQGARGIDLSDLLFALVCFSDVPAADVQALADDRNFPWSAASVGGCAL